MQFDELFKCIDEKMLSIDSADRKIQLVQYANCRYIVSNKENGGILELVQGHKLSNIGLLTLRGQRMIQVRPTEFLMYPILMSLVFIHQSYSLFIFAQHSMREEENKTCSFILTFLGCQRVPPTITHERSSYAPGHTVPEQRRQRRDARRDTGGYQRKSTL
jgi:hypothetical protein